jgi:hypothetical protein
MGDGAEAAMFKGLAEDAGQAGGDMAEAAGRYIAQTAGIEDGNVTRTLITDGERGQSFTDLLTGEQSPVVAPQASGVTSSVGRTVIDSGLSAQVHARATDLQDLLPEGVRGRVTMGVGVGRDSRGTIRNVIGSSERNGYLRKPVADAVQPTEEVARGSGTKHAEARIIDYMNNNSIQPIAVGAGRPICNQCEPVLNDAGAIPASPLKGAPPRG